MSVQDNVFYKAFGVVFAALMLFTVSILLLANKISAPDHSYTDPLVQVELKSRLQPVGRSRVAQ